MSLALYISEVLNPSRALVFSAENPVPINAPELTFSDGDAANIYLVDGSGGYSAASGATGSTVTVSIGLLNAALWTNANWTLVQTPNGWAGELNPSGDALFALFQGRSQMTLTLQVKITDAQGKSRTYLTVPVTIIQSMAPAGVISSIRDGEMAITNGSDSVTVTGLALASVPRRVLVNIQKPDGGSNIFGTVLESSITTDGFTVDLSGAADMDGYKLEYQLTFG